MPRYRNHRRPSRHSSDTIRTDLVSVIRNVLDRQGIVYTAAEMSEFADWIIPELWGQFKKYRNVQRDAAIDELSKANIDLPSGTQGKAYGTHTLTLPGTLTSDYLIEGFDAAGLSCRCDASGYHFIIEGTPMHKGTFPIAIRCKYNGWKPGEPLLQRVVNLEINPDPRLMWRDIPSSENIVYPKADTDKDFVKVEASADGVPQKDIVAASQRGRSHAHEGKPRDDHFQLYQSPLSGWYIMAVADGAGSAKYSRKGSELACKSVVEYLQGKLPGNKGFEDALREYSIAQHDSESEPTARRIVGNHLYKLLAYAAHHAHKVINETSKVCGDGCRPKDFATTLMLAICKKFDFGWFIGTFWVGDGAICIYDKAKQKFKLMGVPDEGEFSGQTRFLTMPEIFSDGTALYNRLNFGIYDDFTALMLMTDGVSDPMFGTDSNLNSIDKWNDFWKSLHEGFPEDNISGVDLSDDNDNAAEQLLQWLTFWKPGEHDDRTLAILY